MRRLGLFENSMESYLYYLYYSFNLDYYPSVYGDRIEELNLKRRVFTGPNHPDDKGTRIVHHHLHIEMRWVGAAHDLCNVFLERNWRIPVYLHNFIGIRINHASRCYHLHD